MFVYVMFEIWIQFYRKLYFTNLAHPKNLNLNLDSTDYGCEIHLLYAEEIDIFGLKSFTVYLGGIGDQVLGFQNPLKVKLGS